MHHLLTAFLKGPRWSDSVAHFYFKGVKTPFGIRPETGRESEREGKSCNVTEVQSMSGKNRKDSEWPASVSLSSSSSDRKRAVQVKNIKGCVEMH